MEKVKNSLILSIICIFFVTLVVNVNAVDNHTLYFRAILSADGYRMTTDNLTVLSEFATGQQIVFITPELNQSYLFSGGVVTVYHENIVYAGEPFLLDVMVFMENNGIDTKLGNATATVYDGTLSNVSCYFDPVVIQKGERISIQINIFNQQDGFVTLHWGDLTHPSRITCEGVAEYIPEFPSWTLLPLFLVTTLIVTIYRKRINKIKSNN